MEKPSQLNRHAARFALALVAALLPLGAAPARAAEPVASPLLDADRFSLGGRVFFGGEIESEVDDAPAGESDAETTLGLFGAFDHPVHQNILIGAEVGLNWWNSEAADDANIDSSMLLTFLVRPKLRHPMLDGSGRLVELYAAVPIGMNVNFSEIPGIDNGVGFSVGVSGGAAYWLWPSAALIGDFGLMSHSPTGEAGSQDVSANFLQFGLSAGLQFAL